MEDLAFVVATVAFFALATGYVKLCGRVIGDTARGVTERGSADAPGDGALEVTT